MARRLAHAACDANWLFDDTIFAVLARDNEPDKLQAGFTYWEFEAGEPVPGGRPHGPSAHHAHMVLSGGVVFTNESGKETRLGPGTFLFEHLHGPEPRPMTAATLVQTVAMSRETYEGLRGRQGALDGPSDHPDFTAVCVSQKEIRARWVEIARTLNRNRFLHLLARDELFRLLAASWIETPAPGRAMPEFRPGEAATDVLIVLNGSLILSEGRTCRNVGVGEIAGHEALARGKPHASTLTPCAGTEILRVPGAVFLAVMQDNAMVARQVFSGVATPASGRHGRREPKPLRVVFVAGRAEMGATTLAYGIAKSLADGKRRVALVDIEGAVNAAYLAGVRVARDRVGDVEVNRLTVPASWGFPVLAPRGVPSRLVAALKAGRWPRSRRSAPGSGQSGETVVVVCGRLTSFLSPDGDAGDTVPGGANEFLALADVVVHVRNAGEKSPLPWIRDQVHIQAIRLPAPGRHRWHHSLALPPRVHRWIDDGFPMRSKRNTAGDAGDRGGSSLPGQAGLPLFECERAARIPHDADSASGFWLKPGELRDGEPCIRAISAGDIARTSKDDTPLGRAAGRVARLILGRSFGVALGGGGALGYAHVSLLKALHEERIPIDFVAGVSVGSLVGAVYAGGGIEALERLANLPRERGEGRTWDPLERIAAEATGPRLVTGALLVAAVSTWPLELLVQQVSGWYRMEDTEIPFYPTGFSVGTGREYYLDGGTLGYAVRSASSLAPMFPSLGHRALRILDGGFVDNVPVAVLARAKCDFVLASNIVPPDPYGERAPKYEPLGERVARLVLDGDPKAWTSIRAEAGEAMGMCLNAMIHPTAVPGTLWTFAREGFRRSRLDDFIRGLYHVLSQAGRDRALMAGYLYESNVHGYGAQDFLDGREIVEQADAHAREQAREIRKTWEASWG